MPTITEIREALATRFATIPGLRVHAEAPGQINPPVAIIIPGMGNQTSQGSAVVSYDSTFARGSNDYLFTAKLVVAKPDDRTAQNKLDSYLSVDGANSLYTALDTDSTLGGLVSFARLKNVYFYGLVPWGNIDYFGADILIEVTD